MYEWFWKVDLRWAAWASRTLHRADLAKADLPGGVRSAFLMIREYLEGFSPGCWPEVERLARSGPVKLDIDEDSYHFARFGMIRRWGQPASKGQAASGWYAWYARFCEERSGAVLSLPEAPDYRPSAKTTAKRRSADDERVRKMF